MPLSIDLSISCCRVIFFFAAFFFAGLAGSAAVVVAAGAAVVAAAGGGAAAAGAVAAAGGVAAGAAPELGAVWANPMADGNDTDAIVAAIKQSLFINENPGMKTSTKIPMLLRAAMR